MRLQGCNDSLWGNTSNQKTCFLFSGDLSVCQQQQASAAPCLLGSSSVTLICDVQTLHTENPRKNNHYFCFCFFTLQFGVTSYITVQINYNDYPIETQNKAQKYFLKQLVELALRLRGYCSFLLLFTRLIDKHFKRIFVLFKEQNV